MYEQNASPQRVGNPVQEIKDPKFQKTLKYIGEALAGLRDKLNFTEDKLHTLLNQRVPENKTTGEPKPMPSDVAGELDQIMIFIEQQSQRISNINMHLESIV